MRHLLLYLILSATFFSAFSQNTGIGVGTTNPHPSAEFEVNSTNKGFLPPRMTFAQRNAIVNPSAGLIVWCSDCLPEGEVQVFNGNRWTNMTGGTAAGNYVQLPSVTIGTQIWALKNLDVPTYRNGDSIPQVTDPNQWASLTTGAWCWYNNDSANYAATYGRLYNWYAVNDSRGLAPQGWHVPTDLEWVTLENTLGGASVAGGAMKEEGTIHWLSPNTGATNNSGFTGLPSGFRNYDGYFYNIGYGTNFWSLTELNAYSVWNRYLYFGDGNVYRGANDKKSGFSVRVVRD